MSDPLRFSYDADRDIIEIEGVKYSGRLFREWSEKGMVTGTLFEFVRNDGAFTVRRIWSPEKKEPA